MKKKLIYLLSVFYAFAIHNPISAQVYKTLGTDYVIKESSIYMNYNPPQPESIRGGILRNTSTAERLSNVALFITNNKTETDTPTKKLNLDGMKLNLFYPEVLSGQNAANQELPVIVFGYGGGFLNAYSLLNLGQGPADGFIERWLAKKGYIVIAPEYRIGIDLYDAELAKRAVWRAVQDIRKVIRKCKSLKTSEYSVDANKPITYVGYSSGGFIGLHNLYFNETNRPTSTRAGYTTTYKSFFANPITVTTSDLGTLDNPVGGYGVGQSDSGMSTQSVPDITISLSGAIGDVSWIKSHQNERPKALYLIHHPSDGVVPFKDSLAYANFGLFKSDNFKYPQVSGSHSINAAFNVASQDPFYLDLITPTNYKYRVLDEFCGDTYSPLHPAPDDDATCIKGNAGGSVGPLWFSRWYHNPTEDASNNDVMQSILQFIQDSTYNIAHPTTPRPISKQSTVSENEFNIDNNIITLYPNPVKGNLLNVTSVEDKTPYKIINTLGQVIKVGFVENTTINIDDLGVGSYFIQLVSHGERIVKTFIKQ